MMQTHEYQLGQVSLTSSTITCHNIYFQILIFAFVKCKYNSINEQILLS